MEGAITCPQCSRTSHDPDDVRERYCGSCHQWHDQMMISGFVEDALGVELAPFQRQWLDWAVTSSPEPRRARASDRKALVDKTVRDHMKPVMQHVVGQLRPYTGGDFTVLDETYAWERSTFSAEAIGRRFVAYVGDLRDAFGVLISEHDPAVCGWHWRDGFRFGGVADSGEPLPPVEGGWPLW